MKSMIERIEAKQKNSQEAYQKNLSQKVKMAKDTNSKMEAVAQRAKQHEEKTLEKKYNQFNKQVKKFHEKLVLRQENLDWQQYETQQQNEKRRQHHMDVSSKLKQLDRNKLLGQIQMKQDQAI